VEASLDRLQVDTVDLLMLHRPDWLSDPEEIARAFAQLRSDGKVREFGVSNFRPTLVSALQKALPFPLQVNQVEIHVRELSCFTDGTLDQCLECRITPMAWSPLQRGKLGSSYIPDPKADDYSEHIRILRALDEAAAEFGADRTVIAIAWLLRHPSNIVPIVGSANPANIRNATRAVDIEIDRDTWYRILLAAQGKSLP
jgi:predicted oxidoreductase